MATRIGRPLVDGIDAGIVRPATPVGEEAAPVRTNDAERLIGDRPVRWWTLAGTWLAMAFSVGVESLNIRLRARAQDTRVKLHQPYR